MPRAGHDRPHPPVWVTREGRVIPIRAMTDRHLYHTIRLLERLARVTWRTPMPRGFLQGDVANFLLEQEQIRLSEMDLAEIAQEIHPRYVDLVEEATRRGVDWK